MDELRVRQEAEAKHGMRWVASPLLPSLLVLPALVGGLDAWLIACLSSGASKLPRMRGASWGCGGGRQIWAKRHSG